MKRNTNVEYLLDTSCWIEWSKESKIGKFIQKKLKKKKKYTASSVIGELRYLIKTDRYFKVKSLVEFESEIIPYDEEIAEYAGQLKKDKPVKRVGWVDYTIVATAKVKNLVVCSTDHHFDAFKNIIGVVIFVK